MKSGNYKSNLSGELEYKSFCPTPLNELELEIDYRTTLLLIEANFLLGKLNGLSSNIIDINQFISSYVRKEALYSSQIEGTQATLEDILDISKEENTNIDIEEVVNYVKAINYAIDLSNELPICNRFIKMVHYQLMQGVRGSEKNPGEFRKTQNWIGSANSTLKNAKYIPPSIEDMNISMNKLEEYINEESNVDDLIKIALIHYQFETIHPFLDGNGRIGRLLIIVYLMKKKKLNYPCLYLSYFLKRNQLEYYDRMSNVRLRDDYIQWIDFFLRGIIETCKDTINCITKLTNLRNKNKQIIKKNDLWLLTFLEVNPIIDAKRTSKKVGYGYAKVNNTIDKFVDLGILKVSNKSKKGRTYIYQEYIDILKEDISS